jgi:predicted O-linked N-acetylglucosamine transferase (SPINDLY family)
MAHSPRALFADAVRQFQQGRFREAERLCRQVLARHPDFADALHLAGVIALQGGDPESAIRRLRHASSIAPGDALVLCDLGNALAASGKSEEAEGCFRRVVGLQPGMPQGHFNLANLLVRQGSLEDAIAGYRRATELEPRFPDAWVNLASALRRAGKPGESEQAARDGLAACPDHPLLLIHVANLLKEKGRLADAEATVRRARARSPGLPLAHLSLGGVLEAQKRLQEAEQSFREALRLQSGLAEAHYGLGNVLQDQGQVEAAIAEYRKAVTLVPDFADAHFNLAKALRAKGEAAGAEQCYRRVLELNASAVDAMNNLAEILLDSERYAETVPLLERAISLAPERSDPGLDGKLAAALLGLGRLQDAIARVREALRVKPDAMNHSGLLGLMGYDPGLTPGILAEAHRDWARRYAPAAPAAEPFPGYDRTEDRRLRIGYLSPDFRAHSVAYFIAPVIEAHDRGGFEIFCYHCSARTDDLSRRVEALADHWADISGMSDDEAEARIRADRIDILVDLAGHTAENRLLLLARKPAPVLVSWIGYGDTTGMSQVDYRLTDALADPPGKADALHSETLVRLPRCFSCYRPPEDAPGVSPLPALGNGFVSFGCFNNPAKVNERVLDLWARLLSAVPGARLLLKGKAFASPERRELVRQRLADHGVVPERVELCGETRSVTEHLAMYGRVDIALDPFPYNGVTTTCEALWMGVPVVALEGAAHRGRVGVTLLAHSGYPQWVAKTEDEYLGIAVRLASDLPALARVRAELREALRRSPLLDARSHTREVEAAYRDMWRKWCSEACVNE